MTSKRYEQNYRAEWEQDPAFSKWLSKTPNEQNAFCKACNCQLLPRIASIKTHAGTAKHKRRIIGYTGTTQV